MTSLTPEIVELAPQDAIAVRGDVPMATVVVEAGFPVSAAGMWECYLSDPDVEPDPATWRTLIVCPLA